MTNTIHTLKHIGLLATALTIALAANFAYGQWADPTDAPPRENALAPLDVSGEYQNKQGDLGALRMRSNSYCDADGGNCFTPTGSTTVASTGGDVVVVAGRCYAPSDNVQIDGKARNIIEEVACNPVACEVRFISRVRNNNRNDVRTITQTSASGLAAISYWQHHDDNPPSYMRHTERFAGDSWGSSWNDRSERAYTYYLDDTMQTTSGAGIASRAGSNYVGYQEFPLVAGATASLVGWGSPYYTRISAEVLNCNPL